MLKASLISVKRDERDTEYNALLPKSMSLTESSEERNKVVISDSQISITPLSFSSNEISGKLSLMSSTINTAEFSIKELSLLHL